MSLPSHLPKGDYPAAAAVHLLDLEETADRLLAKLPGHGRHTETLAREGGTSLVMMAMEAGDAVKEHSAPGTVGVQCLRGHVALTARGQALELRPGQMAFLQPGVPHDLSALEQSVVVLTVSGGR